MSVRSAAVAALALLALVTVLTPWYALDEYTPNGWDASWWVRAAALAAIAAIVALRIERDREAAALAAVALLCIAFRAVVPPDFGFDFDGLEVPTERSWGLWLGLAAALAAAAATLRLARARGDSVAA